MSYPPERLQQLDAFFRASNYLAVAQLYLRQNALLREPLRAEDIKARLLGHWGTVPGLTFAYAHLNRLVQDTGCNTLYIAGTGHGAPGVLACLYLEGTLGEYYPAYSQSYAGLSEFVRSFSWPGGLPSHLTALTPGTLHEGGELGYSLVHAVGAAFDNPDLLVACVVGDGEAETGPLAASWHSTKFLSPERDGAVLPILHLNGYKLSGPSFYARMSEEELRSYFTGCGWQMREVAAEEDTPAAHEAMWEALDWAYGEIRRLQTEARAGRTPERPHWPMLVLRTPKGWTGVKTMDGKPVEGTFHSHQVPISDPAQNPDHLRLLEQWLRSYKPEELFDADGRTVDQVRATVPTGDKRMGHNPQANGGELLQPLPLPDYASYAVEVQQPGGTRMENTAVLGHYLRDVFRNSEQERNFRLFCPDETSSNRLQAVFEATQRVFTWPMVETDENLSLDGRVVEILSEHCCQGWLEGYVLSGRHGMFACYEAFLVIVDSMMAQYAKWIKMSTEIPWRKPVASLNYVITSHVWEQDHNGYSHQGPSFLNMLLTKKATLTRIYLPPDANCLLSVADHCLRSREYVNLIVTSKKPMPQWLDMPTAQQHCAAGASVWEWASNQGDTADVVLACAGDVPTRETLAAAWWLQREMPDLHVRVVNVVDLFAIQSRRDHPHGLEDDHFLALFGQDTEIVFAFHGYPNVVHELIHHRPNPFRFHVRGYNEEGTTTTPFDMCVLNRTSRYDLAIEALRRTPRLGEAGQRAIPAFEEKLRQHRVYIEGNDQDMPEVQDWKWTGAGEPAGPEFHSGVTETV